MTPEKILVIAKGMLPHEIIEIEDNEVWIMNYPSTMASDGRGMKILATQYNPLEDNNQLVDIIKKLLSNSFYISKDLDNNQYELWRDSFSECIADTHTSTIFNEAICNAAYEYFMKSNK